MFPKETRLPDYYNGKFLIYDWIRGWIKAVTMLPNGDFDKMEPFFPSIKVNSLIDMEVGPEVALSSEGLLRQAVFVCVSEQLQPARNIELIVNGSQVIT